MPLGEVRRPRGARPSTAAAAPARTLASMEIRLCDDRGADGFSWIVDEPATRTSHVLASDGRVWLVDPILFAPALERASALGTVTAVLQLLDRHNRDCAAIAAELGVPHLVAPVEIPRQSVRHDRAPTPATLEGKRALVARSPHARRAGGGRDEPLLHGGTRTRRRASAAPPVAAARGARPV